MQTDVLIVGSGIAGLSCAHYIATQNPTLNIILLDKSAHHESNTAYAQGGMAAVLNLEKDNIETHARDTFLAGGKKSDPHIIQKVVEKAPSAIQDLQKWGVLFDRNPDNSLSLGLEGGHTYPRIVHHKDYTGREIQQKLLKGIKSFTQIKLLPNSFSLDLIVEKREGEFCSGLLVLDFLKQKQFPIYAGATILATGGAGRLFMNTTNPTIATGDGVATALRAGVKVRDLSYFQFHPTAMYQEGGGRSPLITEAIRGAGAYILDHQHRRFLLKGDSRGELATRDVVTDLIFKEMKESGRPYVFLDARHLSRELLEKEFPQVVKNCRLLNLDISNDLIPVVPAAHYQCGGILVDEKGRSSLRGLYAIGECASTGLHGANRLASNSLTEAMVFAKEVAGEIVDQSNRVNLSKRAEKDSLMYLKNKNKSGVLTKKILVDLQKIMTASFRKREKDIEWNSLKISDIHNWQIQIEKLLAAGMITQEIIELRNLLEVASSFFQELKTKQLDVEHYQNIQF